MIKSLLYIDSGDLDSASKWSDKAEEFCRASKCESLQVVYNLKGRVLLLRDKVSDSQIYAKKGLGASGGSGVESANSLRLMADASLALEDYSQAEKLYGQALVLDKKFGLPLKIALDLLGMGRASMGVKDNDRAREYLIRAHDVSKSSSVRAYGISGDIQEDISILLKTLEPADK